MDLVGMLDEIGPVPQPLALSVQTEDHAACAMLCATWYIYLHQHSQQGDLWDLQTDKRIKILVKNTNNIFMFILK